jgi:hypothetical protein
MEPFVSNLESFVKSYGDDGKAELNTLCPEHRVELVPQEDTKFSYGGLQIKDGVLRLVFAEGNVGVNVSGISTNFHEAIKDAPTAAGSNAVAYNIIARNSVREDYEKPVVALQESIGKLVGVPGIVLKPNFENNATALANAGDKVRDDWDSVLGRSSLSYFEGLESNLKYAGFKDDDMLQEGFQEGVHKNEILLRVADKLVSGSYHEILIDDGVLVIQVSLLVGPLSRVIANVSATRLRPKSGG